MAKPDHIPQVAILVGMSLDWGRGIVRGILSYANEVGPWHLWVRPNRSESLEKLPSGWRGDGVIARVTSSSLAREITDSGLPAVDVSDSQLEEFSAPCVRTDDRVSTRMAAEHFINRGFRNLAFVGPRHMANPIWYADAFQSTLAEQGLSCEIYPAKDDEPDHSPALTEWLVSLSKPVGILTWGHNFGREVVDRCLEAGISVPHDVSVLGGGYDDLLSHACFPALSGVLLPIEQIGYHSAKLLHQMMRGEEVPHKTTYLPPIGIMERLSTDTLAVDDPKLVKVVEYLRHHAYEPITMKDILREVPMARRSLERRFQHAFGRSPLDEIRRLRVDKARRLLVETDLPMQHIAEACGYATYNYLTHVFKQTTGVTPRSYRRQFSK